MDLYGFVWSDFCLVVVAILGCLFSRHDQVGDTTRPPYASVHIKMWMFSNGRNELGKAGPGDGICWDSRKCLC